MTRYEQQDIVSLRYSNTNEVWAWGKIVNFTGDMGPKSLGPRYIVKIIGRSPYCGRDGEKINWGSENILIGKYPLGKVVNGGLTLRKVKHST